MVVSLVQGLKEGMIDRSADVVSFRVCLACSLYRVLAEVLVQARRL